MSVRNKLLLQGIYIAVSVKTLVISCIAVFFFTGIMECYIGSVLFILHLHLCCLYLNLILLLDIPNLGTFNTFADNRSLEAL